MRRLLWAFTAVVLSGVTVETMAAPSGGQIGELYGFYMGQIVAMELIGSRYPTLSNQAVRAKESFQTTLAPFVREADSIASTHGASQWETMKRNIKEQCRAELAQVSLTPEKIDNARSYIRSVEIQAEGDFPANIREILRSFDAEKIKKDLAPRPIIYQGGTESLAVPGVRVDTLPKDADIRKLLDLMGVRATANKSLSEMISMFRRNMPSVPSAVWIDMRNSINLGDMIELVVPLYAKYLSHGDILELIRFYESPTGRRFADVQPQLIQESIQAGEIWGEACSNTLRRKLQQRGYTMSAPQGQKSGGVRPANIE